MIIAIIILIIISLAFIYWGVNDLQKENYGNPPGYGGYYNNLNLIGWSDLSRIFEGNTVSSISHCVERSA